METTISMLCDENTKFYSQDGILLNLPIGILCEKDNHLFDVIYKKIITEEPNPEDPDNPIIIDVKFHLVRATVSDKQENEIGLDKDEIDCVMYQANCSRNNAIKTLRKYNNIVDVILELTP